MRKLQGDDIRRTWEEQMDEKKNRPAEDNTVTDFTIGYEDPLAKERGRAQQAQMARWSHEQSQQSRQKKKHEKDEDNAYADMLRAMDEIRGSAEEEESKMRKEMTAQLCDDNKRLAEEQRLRKLAQFNRGDGTEGNTLPMWTAGGGGNDAFCGFSDAKRKEILSENVKIMAYKKDMAQRDRELEDAWGQEQMLAAQAMAAAELEERQLREMMKANQRELLKDQIDERREREAREKGDRGEPIGEGFFDGFGVVWR
jgi:hypothetical protein